METEKKTQTAAEMMSDRWECVRIFYSKFNHTSPLGITLFIQETHPGDCVQTLNLNGVRLTALVQHHPKWGLWCRVWWLSFALTSPLQGLSACTVSAASGCLTLAEHLCINSSYSLDVYWFIFRSFITCVKPRKFVGPMWWKQLVWNTAEIDLAALIVNHFLLAGICRNKSKRWRRRVTSGQKTQSWCWASRGEKSPCSSTRYYSPAQRILNLFV